MKWKISLCRTVVAACGLVCWACTSTAARAQDKLEPETSSAPEAPAVVSGSSSPPTLTNTTSEPADSEKAPSKSDKAAADAKKKAADALKKKVATAYKDVFYNNDFSYLNDPNYHDHHLGEELKQLPVGSTTLDLGGQYRLRYHSEHNMRGYGLTGRDDDFLLDRTRLFANWKVNDRIRVCGEVIDAGSSFENFAPRTIEVNQLDIQNLFADVVAIDSDEGKLTLRGGRQELLLGAQRLISPLDWANTRRTFEGGRATWSTSDSSTDLLLVRPIIVQPRSFDEPYQDQVVYGAYHSRKTSELGPIDLYYLGFEDNIKFFRVHTLGALLKGEKDNWLWDNEFAYQMGRNPDSSDISAFSLTFGGGRALEGDLKPKLMLYYDWASGDDSINNGFNHIFPWGHRYLGFMDFYARRNLHDLNALFTMNPTDKWTLLSWYHYFALSNGNQGPYNLNNSAFNPGGTVGSRDLGHEIDLLSSYKFTPRAELCLGYSHFFAGKYYRTSLNSAGQPLFGRDADFLYSALQFNF